eukprot:SM000057S18417  [mRNA]  locus=s57:502647:505940:+ [translate_table: standard]
MAPRSGLLVKLFSAGALAEGAELEYRKSGQLYLAGVATPAGVRCGCCGAVVTLSDFEKHARSTAHRPAAHIFLRDGPSLAELQATLQDHARPSQSLYAQDSSYCLPSATGSPAFCRVAAYYEPPRPPPSVSKAAAGGPPPMVLFDDCSSDEGPSEHSSLSQEGAQASSADCHWRRHADVPSVLPNWASGRVACAPPLYTEVTDVEGRKQVAYRTGNWVAPPPPITASKPSRHWSYEPAAQPRIFCEEDWLDETMQRLGKAHMPEKSFIQDSDFEPLFHYGNELLQPLDDFDGEDDGVDMTAETFLTRSACASKKRDKASVAVRPDPLLWDGEDGGTDKKQRLAGNHVAVSDENWLPTPPTLIEVPQEGTRPMSSEMLQIKKSREELTRLTAEASEEALQRLQAAAIAQAQDLASEQARMSAASRPQSDALPDFGEASRSPDVATGTERETTEPLKVTLVVQCKEGTSRSFRLNRDEPFAKLIKGWAKVMGGESSEYVLSFDGLRVDPSSTPASLDMENDDILEVYSTHSR